MMLETKGLRMITFYRTEWKRRFHGFVIRQKRILLIFTDNTVPKTTKITTLKGFQ